ncbi:uncharacterized protein BYT42DRAFT_596262 [Radiomyces spectabilis]|uniref:uncharacterized protein n=1 Tax=Radiomyces spectabilis TaxID=64574 RepID=UPI00221E4210|nr:uncharacterized protein BYT42DRAFT_596262 [Radiomyces spectabilis]KAI8393312.1 hypothetical protein BYT42DRAFT_596262 [Radiomyces spectabilis]
MMTDKEDDQDHVEVDDLLTFELPPYRLPGQDLLTKQILKMQTTTDLLAVPKGTYATADSEWKDGRSDVLSVPPLGIQNSLPPILIEVQKTVHEPFMQRLIDYARNVYKTYKSYPIPFTVMVTKFKAMGDDHNCFHSIICCDFWAKSCHLISKTTMATTEVDGNLRSLHALSLFLISTLYGHTYANDPTIQRLYHIAKGCLENHARQESNFAESIDVICSKQRKNFPEN